MAPPTPKDQIICVFDSPRTCSQVFAKLFSAHPGIQLLLHPFKDCSMYGPDRLKLAAGKECQEAKAALATKHASDNETYDTTAKRLVASVRSAQAEGRIPWVKDHIICLLNPSLVSSSLLTWQNPTLPELQENPTMIPNDIFNTLTPIILIRHPGLRIPSYFRSQRHIFKAGARDDEFVAFASLRWSRIMIDTFQARGKEVIVIDAEDIVYQTERLVRKLCEMLGIEQEKVKREWESVPEEEWPEDDIMRGFLGDLFRSKGIVRGKKSGESEFELERAFEGWVGEFGVEVADGLRELVVAEMPLYEELRGLRMVV